MPSRRAMREQSLRVGKTRFRPRKPARGSRSGYLKRTIQDKDAGEYLEAMVDVMGGADCSSSMGVGSSYVAAATTTTTITGILH